MDDRVWRNVSIMLGVVCACLIGVAGALMIVGNKGNSSPTSGPESSNTTNASASPSSGATRKPSATPTTNASPTPAAPVDALPASLEFDGMQLDAEKTSGASARTFTFTSDGAGPVTVNVTKASANTTTRLCIKVGTDKPACKVGKQPNFLTAKADGPHDTWTVTAIGYGTTKPTINIVFAWPSAGPLMTLSHGRLQGDKAAESLNGVTAVVKPRVAGVLNVQASWTVITADIDVTLLDNTTPPAVTVDDRLFKGVTYINPAYTYNVDPTKTYLVKIRNKSADTGKPDLTAQIAFP